MLPDTEYTPEEQEKLLDRIADQIVRRRLEMPAALFLEMHRPLRFFAGQGLLLFSPLLVLFSPLLGAFFGLKSVDKLSRFVELESVYKLSRFVEHRDSVDRLLDRIEQKKASATGTPVASPERPNA
jgi:hypothetical protein